MKLPRIFNYSRTVLWIGTGIVIYIFVILVNENSNNFALRKKAATLESQNSQLQSDIADLNNKIAYYNTDAYKEKVAREKLQLQKPGESVVIVPHDENTQGRSEDTLSKESDSPPKSNWAQWIEFLFGSGEQT